MARLLLTDDEWGLIADVLLEAGPSGRPRSDPREVVDGTQASRPPDKARRSNAASSPQLRLITKSFTRRCADACKAVTTMALCQFAGPPAPFPGQCR